MAEIDDFRPRIRNWARVYRDRFIRFESNLMMLIRALKRLDQTATSSSSRPPDYEDAEFLDDCILALRQRAPDFEAVFPVLKAEYLTRYSNETFETTSDEKKATRCRARYADTFVWRYNDSLRQAEIILMRYVKQKETVSKEQHNAQDVEDGACLDTK